MAAKPAMVGGFVLGALLLGVAAVLLFGSTRLFASTSRAVIFFEGSVAGLDVGAPVTFRGVRLGSVAAVKVEFSPATRFARIPVYIEIQPDRITWEGRRGDTDYHKLVGAGLRAQLASQSLVTGQMRVDLDFHPDTPIQMVGTGTELPEIPAIPSELDQLRSKLTDLPLRKLADTAERALSSIDRLASHLDSVLNPVSGSVSGAADAATRTMDTASDVLRQLQPDALSALRRVDTLAADARGQLDARGGEISRLTVDSDRAVRQAERLIGVANDLLEPRSVFRGDLDASARDLSATAGALRDFAHSIERDPSALLTGRTAR